MQDNTELIKRLDAEWALIEQKKQTWAILGVQVYHLEQSMNNDATATIATLGNHPVTIFEVPAAETRLKEAKKKQGDIEVNRKEMTSKFDALTSRLMGPAKSISGPIQNMEQAIIAIKKKDQAEKVKEKNIQDEIVRCTEFCKKEQIRIDAELQNRVLDLVARCYRKALDSSIDPRGIMAYISESKLAVTDKAFTYDVPVFDNGFITDDKMLEISKDNFNIDQQSYVTSFGDKLNEKFSDYETAFSNKAQALALAQQEAETQKLEIEIKAKQQQVANQIESFSVTSTPAEFYTKALKQTYEIDMEETLENAMKIISAFTANMVVCMPHLRVSKWFTFGAAQAGKALAKLKSEDNNFSATGITFKIVDKL